MSRPKPLTSLPARKSAPRDGRSRKGSTSRSSVLSYRSSNGEIAHDASPLSDAFSPMGSPSSGHSDASSYPSTPPWDDFGSAPSPAYDRSPLTPLECIRERDESRGNHSLRIARQRSVDESCICWENLTKEEEVYYSMTGFSSSDSPPAYVRPLPKVPRAGVTHARPLPQIPALPKTKPLRKIRPPSKILHTTDLVSPISPVDKTRRGTRFSMTIGVGLWEPGKYPDSVIPKGHASQVPDADELVALLDAIDSAAPPTPPASPVGGVPEAGPFSTGPKSPASTVISALGGKTLAELDFPVPPNTPPAPVPTPTHTLNKAKSTPSLTHRRHFSEPASAALAPAAERKGARARSHTSSRRASSRARALCLLIEPAAPAPGIAETSFLPSPEPASFGFSMRSLQDLPKILTRRRMNRLTLTDPRSPMVQAPAEEPAPMPTPHRRCISATGSGFFGSSISAYPPVLGRKASKLRR